MAGVDAANMTDSRSSSGRLFVLDLSGGRVFSLNPDGSDPKNTRHRMPASRWPRGRFGGGLHLLDQHGRSAQE
jgi:hypothetical protein